MRVSSGQVKCGASEKKKEKKKRSRWGSNPRSFAPEANAFPLRHRTIHEESQEVINEGESGKGRGKRGKKGASPGIEPGPPAPKAGILPLNYKAIRQGREKRIDNKKRAVKKKKMQGVGFEPTPPKRIVP